MMVTRLIPTIIFVAIFVAHALYVGACAASAPSGWSDFGMSATASGPLGLGAYWRGQDYLSGFPMPSERPSPHGRSLVAFLFAKQGSRQAELLWAV